MKAWNDTEAILIALAIILGLIFKTEITAFI